MKISFCTTCMNRLKHLQETLPQNLADNPDFDGLEVEFVVLNYNSRDNELPADDKFYCEQSMHEWMTTDPRILAEIESGRIIYARMEEAPTFHHSHAKNMAHRLATGDVVCNLDADNYAGPGFAVFLAKIFQEKPNAIVNPSHAAARKFEHEQRGFFGRIALLKERFLDLGGYSRYVMGRLCPKIASPEKLGIKFH